MTGPIHSPAGTALPLASGGLLLDCGDAWPRWVPDRDKAREELAVRELALRLKQHRDKT